jgi:signal transduction histidine kinase/ligand-binding sensor domain-containing protein/CheY-like chemotaxis protein
MLTTKMHKKNKCIFIALVLFQTLFHSAKAENWHPINVLSTINGLPTDEVKQVYQDKEGYIWIATGDGLCRYDGYQLKTYKTNLYTPDLLSSNKLTAIAEDGNHNLWIGTTNGLNVLNKITGKIRRIDTKKLANNNIQAILVTKENVVWIGTANGLNKYNADNDSFTYYDNASTNYRLRGNDIKTLIEDHKGNIWIGTWNGGITRYDPSKNTFYPYPKINPSNSAHVIFEDNQHNIWVGSWGYGLFRLENPYNPQKTTYINYRHYKNDAGSLSDNIVYALSQDLNTNTIWVGTRSGLSILNDNKNTSSFTNHLPNQSERFLLYNEVNSILRDNSGLMWLGTLGGGVSIVNTQRIMFNLNQLTEVKNKIYSNSVRSIYIDNNGINWLGIGSYGLVSYNPSKNKYTFYEDHPDFAENPINSTVYSTIQPYNTNSYWFATYGQGIFIYNPALSNNKVRNIRVNTHPWLANDCVYYLKEDNNHNIWIGTTDGISVYYPKTNKGVSYPYLGQKINGTKHYAVFDIEESDKNTIWLATAEDGVFKVDKNSVTSKIDNFYHYSVENKKLNNNNVQCLYKDRQGRLWLGSEGGGLSLYDAEKDAFVSVQQKYNLPGDIVYNIVEDDKGDLWLGTNAGLITLKFSSDSSAVNNRLLTRQYTITDGLQDNSFNRNAIFKSNKGELYFGGHKGFNVFYPSTLSEKNIISPIVITDIKIFNKSLEILDKKLRNKISENAPGYTRKIRLPYNYNNFSIEFASLSYSNSMQSKYAYILNGFDKEWQYTDATRRFASYNNLKNGTYSFYLKSSNENGVWSETIKLQIVILPPPWLTWWAFLIYFCLIISAVYFSLKITRSKLLLQNAIRVRDVEKQKIEELNHAKLQFFTNITHEFLTPLTILSASVDELKIISPQNKEFYAVMSNNISRLIRLLQQILEFRKAEAGNLKLKVSKGDIADFVKAGVDSFKPLMKKNKMHFSLLCDPESIIGYFDQDKLDKILFNLLSNASKYNKPGGSIQVDLHYDLNDKNKVILSVKDNGEGIQPQAIKGLFKRFYEGDYRRFNTIGTGIGLSLTKDLVELHKGEISVESEVGVGTTFYIKLPINQESYTENEIDDYTYLPKTVLTDTFENDENDENDELEEIETLKHYSLLLIEDNEELLQLMMKLLSREYNVFTAKNGKDGIEILETEDIDLAVSDIMMPVMNGIEFCKAVKSKFEISHVPIILLTAKTKEEDRIEAYDSGADGFISKPFNLNVLHSKIKNLLKSKERTAQEFKKQFIFEVKDMNFTSMDEEFLARAIDCVHKHIDDTNFDQQHFADALSISKSTLYKKLKSLTGLNTSSFIRNIRLKTACKIIDEKKKLRISELAYAVGFNDPKYFSACFKKEFGLIPSEYLDRILASVEDNSLDTKSE